MQSLLWQIQNISDNPHTVGMKIWKYDTMKKKPKFNIQSNHNTTYSKIKADCEDWTTQLLWRDNLILTNHKAIKVNVTKSKRNKTRVALKEKFKASRNKSQK